MGRRPISLADPSRLEESGDAAGASAPLPTEPLNWWPLLLYLGVVVIFLAFYFSIGYRSS